MKLYLLMVFLLVGLVTAPLLSQTEGVCPPDYTGYLQPRLQIYTDARVTPGGLPNRLRNTPSIDGEQIALIDPGEIIFVVDGPRCDSANRIIWWQVTWNNQTGWTAEGLLPDSYFLEPLNFQPVMTSPPTLMQFPTNTPILPTRTMTAPTLSPPSATPSFGMASPTPGPSNTAIVSSTPIASHFNITSAEPIEDVCRSYIALTMTHNRGNSLFILDTETGDMIWEVLGMNLDYRSRRKWSHDGTRLLVTAISSADFSKEVMYVLDVVQYDIAELVTPAYGGQWSPVDDAVAYYNEDDTGREQVSLIVNGGEPQSVAVSSTFAWMPDGRLFINGLMEDEHFLLDVHTMERETVIYESVFMGNYIYPSPDGERLAVENNGELLLSERRDTWWGTPEVLASHPSYRIPPPYWSPDGSYLAYVYNGEDIYVTSGGEPINLTADWKRDVPFLTIVNEDDPFIPDYDMLHQVFGWSPDGSRILFSTFGELADDTPGFLYTISTDGERLDIITPALLANGETSWIAEAAWSPCIE